MITRWVSLLGIHRLSFKIAKQNIQVLLMINCLGKQVKPYLRVVDQKMPKKNTGNDS